MQQKRTTKISLFDPDPVDHSVGAILETISAWLDDHFELLNTVAVDLGGAHGKFLGRQGLNCESVLRCAVIRHLHQRKRRKTHKTGSGNYAVAVIPVPPNPVRQIRKNGVTSSRIEQNRGQIVLPGSAPSANWSKAGG